MMLALHQIAEGKSDSANSAVMELLEQAPELIPDIVFELNEWIKSLVRTDTSPA